MPDINMPDLNNNVPADYSEEKISKKLENLDIDKNEEPITDSNIQENKTSTESATEAEEPTEIIETEEQQDNNQPETENFSQLNELEQETHPLNGTWTLWFMNSDNKQNAKFQNSENWKTGLISLYSFNTVEGFWSVYNHIQQPAKLRVKHDYMLFRQGVKPAWEDSQNKNGGMWKVVLPTKMRATDLDRMWLESLLSLVGEAYGDMGDFVMGAYLQRRQREDRIQLWTSDYSNKEANMHIGRIFKATLNLTDDSLIHYLKHDDGSSTGRHQSWQRKHKTDSLYEV